VTNFRFALHPIPPTCWLGVLYFSPDQREEVVEAAMEWRKNVMSADDSVLMATTHSEKDGAPVRRFYDFFSSSSSYRSSWWPAFTLVRRTLQRDNSSLSTTSVRPFIFRGDTTADDQDLQRRPLAKKPISRSTPLKTMQQVKPTTLQEPQFSTPPRRYSEE
jgi:hypothetical protein